MGSMRLASPGSWAATLIIVLGGVLPAMGAGGSPAADALQLDVQFTYGGSGSPRPAHFLPGETVTLVRQVRGIAVGTEGRASLSLRSELLDQRDNVVFTLSSNDLDGPLALGGNTFTGGAGIDLPQDVVPGTYKLKTVATDHVTGREATRVVPFEILPSSQLGALNLRLTHDQEGKTLASFAFASGQKVHLLASINGYTVTDGKMDVTMTLVTTDEAGKQVGQEIRIEANQQVPQFHRPRPFNARMSVPLHRAGKFRFHLTIEDHHSGETADYEIPIVVLDPFSEFVALP